MLIYNWRIVRRKCTVVFLFFFQFTENCTGLINYSINYLAFRALEVSL